MRLAGFHAILGETGTSRFHAFDKHEAMSYHGVMLKLFLGWLAAFTVCLALQQVITLPPETSLFSAPAMFLCGLVSYSVMIIATTALLAGIARRRPAWGWLLAGVVVGSALLALPVRIGAPWPAHIMLDLGAVALAGGLGMIVGRLMRRPGYLVPVLVAAGTIDIYSVFFGPTAKIMRQPVLMSHFLFYWPLLGTDRIRGLIGIADFVFAGLLLAGAVSFGRPLRRTAAAFAAGCIVEFVALWLLPVDGLPILPFIAAAYIIAEWKFLVADRKNLENAAVVSAGVMLIMIPALVYLSSPDPADFSAREFVAGRTPEALLAAVQADLDSYPVPANGSGIDRLNELLGRNDWHAGLLAGKLPPDQRSAELAAAISAGENDQGDAAAAPAIRRRNRLILEMAYPRECPPLP